MTMMTSRLSFTAGGLRRPTTEPTPAALPTPAQWPAIWQATSQPAAILPAFSLRPIPAATAAADCHCNAGRGRREGWWGQQVPPAAG